MTPKHFNAILAKNNIARELRDADTGASTKNGLTFPSQCLVDRNTLLVLLRDIETYTGEGNQPSIDDIINSDIEI